jgi:hypothetical protein
LHLSRPGSWGKPLLAFFHPAVLTCFHTDWTKVEGLFVFQRALVSLLPLAAAFVHLGTRRHIGSGAAFSFPFAAVLADGTWVGTVDDLLGRGDAELHASVGRTHLGNPHCGVAPPPFVSTYHSSRGSTLTTFQTCAIVPRFLLHSFGEQSDARAQRVRRSRARLVGTSVSELRMLGEAVPSESGSCISSAAIAATAGAARLWWLLCRAFSSRSHLSLGAIDCG